MATVTGLTAARVQQILNTTVVSARVENENLILITREGGEINVGKIRFTDKDIADLLASPLSQSGAVLYSAVSNRVSIEVPPQVAQVLANQPAIVAAAAQKAAELAQSAVNLLKAYNQYPNQFYLLDSLGYWSFRNNPDGSVEVPDLKVKRLRVGDSGMTLQESPEGGLLLRDSQGYIQAWFKPDGKTHIGDLEAPSLNIGGIKKVVACIVLGQSNGEGRGNPTSPQTDFVHNRIFAATWNNNNSGQYPTNPTITDLAPATIPLQSQQKLAGLSVGSVVAKEIIRENDEFTHVVILNAAAGGSGLVAQPEQGTWDVNYNGSNPKLYSIATAAITKFKQLLAAKYPGITVEYRILWHQGEADTATSQSAYSEALDNVLTGIRSTLGSQNIPISIGGLVPEWIGRTGSGAQSTRKSLMDTQKRLMNVAYTDGVTNGGGSQNINDTVHYGRGAVIELGKKMKIASDRAITSNADAVPHRPLTVNAFWFNDEIKVSWSEPDTRWTNFIIQYGGPNADSNIESETGWTTWTRRNEPIECSDTITGLTGPVKVRIKTVNDLGTSYPTLPTLVIGAHS